MLPILLHARRFHVVILLLLFSCLATSCLDPLRIYTNPLLKETHQRPQSIAILPLNLTVNTTAAPGAVAGASLPAGEADMLQQMLYSIMLQQGSKRPVTIRNIDAQQLPAGPPVINTALAQQLKTDVFLVTQLHRNQTFYPTQATSTTTYNKENATATTTNTPATVSAHTEILLDMALYDTQGQLLWKYNAQTTPWLATSARATEMLMEEGLKKFPFRR